MLYCIQKERKKEINNKKEIKKMTTWTVYFGSIYDRDVSGKKEGTPKKFRKSWIVGRNTLSFVS